MLICCGEALIDMIPARTTEGEEAYVPHTGGAVFNTAVALGRLGSDVAMISGVSTDLFGARLVADMEASKVGSDLLIRSDRPTTMAYVKLTNGSATYSFHDENSAGRMIAPDDLPALPEACKALYFGGISLAVEPGAETYAALCTREAAGHVVMVDPNIRPGFIRDAEAFRDRMARMLGVADIIKISDEDLDWLRDGPDSPEAKARALRAETGAMVILTRGAEGATAFYTGGEVHVPARRAEVVDTVGAGDTFNAGVLASLSEQGLLSKAALREISEEALSQALDFGAQVAAVTVSRAGANPPWRQELE
ncbi:fructokinase [Pseudooceanicola antarcticus]|uniref:Carbohydrate kinase n=1 Tax=Pseudooceanicola antarcticus TaxID=1247613 RepID=A0A285IYF9_9RHOB|nr:carbohydrate kinase [Pseudooceanicola antarcticus]PJE26006.1 carbohydrate kinase [Pseudooceanicola antarcticus]SNY52126.1 fructokinase [Pseudooceanicola antarcticus]